MEVLTPLSIYKKTDPLQVFIIKTYFSIIKNHQTKVSPSIKSKIFNPKNDLKNYVKYLQSKLQEFDHALEQELTYRIEEDQNSTLRKISNWFDLKEITEKYGYDVSIVSLEIDCRSRSVCTGRSSMPFAYKKSCFPYFPK